MTKVLLTGGAGFVATHILIQLLERGHKVVTTVRSDEEAKHVREAHKGVNEEELEVVIVPDIATKGAFDEVAKTPGLEAVLHTASPFHYKFTDPKTELVDPALIGTTSILEAIHRSAPAVKRIVITSSFASILDETRLEDPSMIFTEKDWNPVTMADINNSRATAYRVSKKLAERAAWDFIAAEKPSFDLVTICPPLVLGPVRHHLSSLASINTSNERVVDLIQGKWKHEIPQAYLAGALWVNVRDLARSHILAMEKHDAGGRRLFPTSGRFSNRAIADLVWKNFPNLREKLPGPDVPGGELAPLDKMYGFDNSETVNLLGIEWTNFETTITDLVKSLEPYDI